MSGGGAFESPQVFLSRLLERISTGNIQLPDFQRGWIWDDDHVRSLLASVSLAYPIGAAMAMVTGNDDVRFKPRLFEGVTTSSLVSPDWLILDGQQRLTALYQSLYSGRPVETIDARRNRIKRWYYIRMEQALNPDVDREEAIFGVPEDRIIFNFRGEPLEDYSSPELEYLQGVFPLAQVFDPAGWRRGFGAFWNHDSAKLEFYDEFEKAVLTNFSKYQVPFIVLGQGTPKEAVCQVFEKVNTGGVPLTVFELLTATFAADGFNLREDWDRRSKLLRSDRVISGIPNTDFLQAVTLLATRAKQQEWLAAGEPPERAPAISCKRKDILRLELDDYLRWAEPITEAYRQIPRFLNSLKIFVDRDIPYRSQLVPLSAIIAALGAKAENDGVRANLVRWYWCGVFGELYGSSTETRFAKDLPEVLAWIDGGPEPDTIRDANFAPARLHSLRTRNSAAYKGLHALLMKDGGLDFRSGYGIDSNIYADERIDIHHIFPQDWCRRHGIDANRYDSIVNKTPLSARTNRMIGGNAPSSYLASIQRSASISPDRMDEILRSHVIDPAFVRRDDFEGFFRAREGELLRRIEAAMGKPIAWESHDVGGNELPDEEGDG